MINSIIQLSQSPTPFSERDIHILFVVAYIYMYMYKYTHVSLCIYMYMYIYIYIPNILGCRPGQPK